jgi:hypothetical protein
MFLMVSYFMQVQEFKKCLQTKDAIGIIYGDLNKE